MNKGIIQIKVFVSCPSDVEQEKQIVRDVCDSLTKALSKSRNIQVKTIEWRSDVIPFITGEGPQSVINKQIEESDYDIYIGILWKRFGDKQSNGLTPTEGEFKDALRRSKETGKPIVQFYFKLDEFYPSGSYEALQAFEIQQFKERIRDFGLYDEFRGREEFQKKVYESILYTIENLNSLTSKKTTIPKTKYPEIPHYLLRKVYPTKDYSSSEILFLRTELSQDILSLIVQHNRIVLLSDAGVGKTTELQRIAWHFSNNDSPFYPFLVPLNKYVNQDLSELLPPNWSEIPESQILIILDGLDEIESKNKNGAIRQVELFSEQYPSSHIIVSCRTNFYKSETKQSSGTLSRFSSYVLLDLDGKEIKKYIETRLDKQARNFNEVIFRNQFQELLRIPFHLIRLVELFEANRTLPQNKAEIFEQLLFDRIQLDVEHFRTTIELNEKRKTIIETLERLALGMELLGRNYINNDDYQQLIPDESVRTLVNHCTVWKKNEGEIVTWQFEHNNFQEYLAARVLSRQSLEIIKDFISFKPDHRKVIPSWVNTLSFLISIIDKHVPLFDDILNWIKDIEPELVVKFEPDKVETATRIHIFKSIFGYYKERQIWINPDKFRYSELAQFGQSDEIVDYLLTEAETATHHTTFGNAVELIGELQIPHSQRQRTSQFLVRCALDDNRGEQVQKQALIALADLKINSQEVINQIVPVLYSSDSTWVRFGLYYFLYNSDHLDENIEILLEGIKYVRFHSSTSRETRLANEQWHLKIGLEKAKSPSAIRRIIAYFKEHPRGLDDAYFEESISVIAENAANSYSKEPLLFESVIDLFGVLVREHLEKEAKKFIYFFDKTDTRLQAFKKVFAQRSGNKEDCLVILATLADTKCIEFFVDQYEEYNITDDVIWTFQDYLGWKNHYLYLPFNKLINEKSGNKFILPPKRDFDKEIKQRRQRDIDLLFDKEAFLKEIKLIFATEQKQTFTSKDLLTVETHRWDNPYFSDLAIHALQEIAGNQTVSFETVIQVVNHGDRWDLFCIGKIYGYLESNQEAVLSKKQKDWIANWCIRNLNKVNFKKALLTEANNRFSTSYLAIYLWYFLKKLNLTYPQNVLLDLLSFNWFEGHQRCGIKYLEGQLSEVEITARILENLQEGIENNDVLKNHIDYCKRHNIKEVLPFALHEIADPTRDNEGRQVALETFCEISETLSELKKILPEITDDFKWDIVEELVKRNSKYSYTFLLEILAGGNEQDQFKAAEYLIELQDLEGLKYYVEWIKRHKEFPEKSFKKAPLLSLRILESVPFLIELLKISYQDDFVQDEFRRLDPIVLDTLTAIALQSDQHYIEIKEVIENFISKYSLVIKNVNFLHAFIEKLEQKYYVIKSEKLDISDVTKKLEKI